MDNENTNDVLTLREVARILKCRTNPIPFRRGVVCWTSARVREVASALGNQSADVDESGLALPVRELKRIDN